MKIVIDDQYQNDENKQYTVDENGNVNLFISVGDEVGTGSTINKDINLESDNIEYNEKEDFLQKDLGELQENLVVEDTEVQEIQILENKVEDEISESSTINNENPWEEEKFSRNYHNIYAEIENKLEEKYAVNNDLEEKYEVNNDLEEKYEVNNDLEEKYESNNKLEEKYTYNDKEEEKIDVCNNRINKEYFIENEVNSFYEEKREVPEKNEVEEKGTIEVFSRLGSKEGVELKGARINLYLLNGISPKLYDSKFTDSIGKVTFNNLPNGCYRIIAIVDRRFFEKPMYYNWNEVIIDKNNKTSSILVVNRIKAAYHRR